MRMMITESNTPLLTSSKIRHLINEGNIPPETEKLIASHAQSSYTYAIYTKKPWCLGEAVIAKDPEYAFKYAYYVLKRQFKLGENSILSVPSYALRYTKRFKRRRWDAAEKTIIKDASTAYEYARDIIKGRWLEAESTILSMPDIAVNYSFD